MSLSGLPPSRDARAERSARALSDAMLALIERTPLDQITVRGIVGEAGVHYATFFRHHASKEALLDHIAAEQIDRLVALTLPLLDRGEPRASVAALTAYVSEHRRLWTALLTGGAAGAMRAELLRISSAVAAERGSARGWLPVELGVACSVSLIFETLAWWLGRPEGDVTDAEVAAILDRLLRSTGQLDRGGGARQPSPDQGED